MNYHVKLSKNAERSLDVLPNEMVIRIYETLKKLSANPRPFGYKKLKNREGYRIRSGDYRIIYTIDNQELLVFILTIGHRKNVYE